MSGRRTASPARQRAPSPSGGRKPGGASYSSLLAEIERTSVPKPGARPPTDVGTTEEGREWLAKNAQQDGVVTLPCGMQYKVLKAAKADAASPKLATECMCHYTGKRTDGFEFDSSKKRGKPACFAPKNVIRGWTIAMQIMGVGDKWMLYIPSEYAYGDAGRRDERRGEYIPPGQVLVFELELLEVNGPSKPRPKRPADMPNASTPTAVVGPAAVVDVSEVAPSVEPEMETEMVRPPTALPTKASPLKPPAKLSAEGAFDDGVDATLEAVSTLLGRLELSTLRQALTDLGLAADGGKHELSERITNALQTA